MNNQQKVKYCGKCFWKADCKDCGIDTAEVCNDFWDGLNIGNFEEEHDRDIDMGMDEPDEYGEDELQGIELHETNEEGYDYTSMITINASPYKKSFLYVKEESEYIQQNGECVSRQMTDEEKERYGVKKI